MEENCPHCNSKLIYTSYTESIRLGKQKIGYHFIDNKNDVRENEKLAQLCPKCEWNTMGLPKGFTKQTKS